jgi:hypothetical protein
LSSHPRACLEAEQAIASRAVQISIAGELGVMLGREYHLSSEHDSQQHRIHADVRDVT